MLDRRAKGIEKISDANIFNCTWQLNFLEEKKCMIQWHVFKILMQREESMEAIVSSTRSSETMEITVVLEVTWKTRSQAAKG